MKWVRTSNYRFLGPLLLFPETGRVSRRGISPVPTECRSISVPKSGTSVVMCTSTLSLSLLTLRSRPSNYLPFTLQLLPPSFLLFSSTPPLYFFLPPVPRRPHFRRSLRGVVVLDPGNVYLFGVSGSSEVFLKGPICQLLKGEPVQVTVPPVIMYPVNLRRD